MSLKCPLCGKSKTAENLFCSECTVKLNSEYELSVPALDSSPDNTSKKEEDASQEIIKEEIVVGASTQKFDKKAWNKQQQDDRTDSQKSYYELNRDKKPKRGRFIFVSLFILTLVLVAAVFIYNDYVKGGNLERAKWEVALRENTVDSYLAYMDEYPQGDYGDEAYTNMLSLKNSETEAWQILATSENTSEFVDFLKRYPQSPYDRKVKIRFDSLMWESSLKENSSQAYSEYINMSTTGEIAGDYIGEAQKRYEMLSQSTPVDEIDLAKIKESLNGFLIGLSNMSHTQLSDNLAPVIDRFNTSTNVPRDIMIGQLLLMAAKADAKSLRFDPEITKLKYEKMGNGTYQVNVPVQKVFEGNNGDVNQIKGYIVHLRMDPDFKIFSFHETKPFATAP